MKRITSARLGALAILPLILAACGAEGPESGEATAAETVVGSVLKYGDTATVNWTPTSYWSAYTFTGTAGDLVRVTVTPSTALGDAYVSLKSDGTDGYSRTQRAKTGTAIQMVQTLEASGTWTIEIHNDKNKAADFSLKLEKLPADSCTVPTPAPIVSPTGGSASSVFDGALLKGTAATFDSLVKRMAPGTYAFTPGEGKLLVRSRLCNTVTGCVAWMIKPSTEVSVGYSFDYRNVPERYSEWKGGISSLAITNASTKTYTLGYFLSTNTSDPISATFVSSNTTGHITGRSYNDRILFSAGESGGKYTYGTLDYAATDGQQLITDSYFLRVTGVQRAVAANAAGQYVEGQAAYFQSLVTKGTVTTTANTDNSDVAISW